MKTKEELRKIYSAYLPYDLEICTSYQKSKLNKPKKLIGSDIDRIWLSGRFDIKPILYSMDMLTKPITHKGETFVPLHKILEEYNFDLSKMDEEYILSFKESLIEVDMSYKTANMLLEWHFNIFGLEENEYIKKETILKLSFKAN